MIDTVQAVLLFVIVLLTVLFTVLGVQIFYILKDLRQTIQRTNNILDDVETVSNGLAETTNNVSNILGGASSIGMIAKVIKMFAKKKE